MSSKLVLSTYRSLLRCLRTGARRYKDPNDVCFTVFGIMLNRADFAAAGYGSSLTQIAHSCFVRPIVHEHHADGLSARMAAAFAVIKTLNETEQAHIYARRRRERERAKTQADALRASTSAGQVTLAAVAAVTSTSSSALDNLPGGEGDAVSKKGARGAAAASSPLSTPAHTTVESCPSLLSCAESTIHNKDSVYRDCNSVNDSTAEETTNISEDDTDAELDDEDGRIALLDEYTDFFTSHEEESATDSSTEASSSACPTSAHPAISGQTGRCVRRASSSSGTAPTVAATPTRQHILSGKATILLDDQDGKPIKVERRIVHCEDSHCIPPYRMLLPPEPVYTQKVHATFPFHLMTDALICMSARSRQRRVSGILSVYSAGGEVASVSTAHSTPGSARAERVTESSTVCSSSSRCTSSSCSADVPRTVQDLQRLMTDIATRSVTVTDFMEVEIFTRFVYAADATVGNAVTGEEREGWTNTAGGSAGTARATAPHGQDDVRAPSTSFFPAGGRTDTNSTSSGALAKHAAAPKDHLFLVYICVRNRSNVSGGGNTTGSGADGARPSPKPWHFLTLSSHMVAFSPALNTVEESVHIGLGGTMGMLESGKSHVIQSGVVLPAPEGVIRLTIQGTAFTQDGEMRSMDVSVVPTRLSMTATKPPPPELNTTPGDGSLMDQRAAC